MEIVIILVLILISGVFSIAEISLITARKFKLEDAQKKGSKGAKIALEISDNPTKLISTTQIGITVIGILLGVYSGEHLTWDFTYYIDDFDFIKPYAHDISVTLIVVFITYLSIVLGELIPKKIGMTYPERIAIILAKPMKIISTLITPFVWSLMKTNDLLLKLIGLHGISGDNVSEEEIKSIIKDSAASGEIQNIEQNIVERVFELGDRKVNSLLTHRGEIVFFDINDSWEIVVNKINKEKHSAYPVCEDGNLDKIVGIVLLKNLFTITIQDDFHVKDFMQTPLFINEGSYAYNILELFRDEKTHYGIVINEYGLTVGVLTMDDVVDALLGDLSEEDDDEYKIVQKYESSWIVDGQYPMIEFVKYFDLDLDNINGDYTTIAGLIINMNDTLPEEGDRVVVGNYVLVVTHKNGQRIDKVLVNKIISSDSDSIQTVSLNIE